MGHYNPRIKSDKVNLAAIENWQQADEAVREIADLQTKIQQAQAKAADDINEAKSELAETIKPAQEQIKQITSSIEAFALGRKAEFGKQKSRKLNFGVIGWRKSSSVAIKKTKVTIELIKKLYSAAKAKTFLHIKETVDKEALKKLDDEQLAEVGAKRDNKEIFFVEPAMPEAVDYCE